MIFRRTILYRATDDVHMKVLAFDPFLEHLITPFEIDVKYTSRSRFG